MKTNRDVVQSWLKSADEDFALCQFIFDDKVSIAPNLICYHAKLGVEKLLKAYLIHLNVDIFKKYKTHDLIKLIDAIYEFNDLGNDFYHWVDELVEIGKELRYPTDEPLPTLADALQSVDYFTKIKNHILSHLQP